VELTGLTTAEVAARRARGEGNTPPPRTTRSYGQIFRENVFTFVNYVLFFLGVALVFVGRPLDALVSVSVISLNTAVSVIQEIRAKRDLDRIALLTAPKAKALRDGKLVDLPPEQLVLGDVLQVAPGDQVVLDGRLASGRLEADESLLTGESELISKKPGDPVYSGTFCVTGTGLYEATSVGEASLANRITTGARTFRRVLTPLQKQVNLVVRVLLAIMVSLQLLLVVRALVQNVSLPDAVANATVLAGLVPNGLFLSIAIAYALGSVRLLRFGALVQQSNAVESLSNVDTLVLDKTGTLTANRLKVAAVYAPDERAEKRLVDSLATLAASATASNKTGQAIAEAYPGKAQSLVAEVPFSSARKWSAIATQTGILALGAPEMLQQYLAWSSRDGLDARAAGWQADGLRVLLVAYHPEPAHLDGEGENVRLPSGMEVLGLVALRDELRPEARETLASFRAAGVAPKIISGDNPDTVAALARQAGLPVDSPTASGVDLQDLDDAKLADLAEKTVIFGRISPQDKARLVKALKSRGRYVAMIGDGVNDVLALKTADLAVAMHGGSQASRGVADIVLLNDSFASLVPAVLEGQRIRNGMQGILKLYLTRIGTVAAVIITSLVIGIFPIDVRNGSAVTLFSVGIPTLALTIWARPGAVRRGGLGRDLAAFTLPAAVLSTTIGLLLFYGVLFLQTGLPNPTGETGSQLYDAVVAATPDSQTVLTIFLVLCGLLLVLFVAPRSDRRPFLLVAALAIGFGIIILTPARDIFSLGEIGLIPLGLIVVAVLGWLLLLRETRRRQLIERFLALPPERRALASGADQQGVKI
jgi:cation-transporting ATPase E